MSRLRTDVDIMPANELEAWIDNILSNVHIADVRTINDVLTRELKLDKLQRLAKSGILRHVIGVIALIPRIPTIVYSVLATGNLGLSK